MIPVVHLGPIHFYSFGLVLGIAIWLGWTAIARFYRQHQLYVNEPLLGALIVGFGLLGSKLDSLVMETIIAHHQHVHGIVSVGQGYSYLGGILFGLTAAAIYARKNGLPLLRFFDGFFGVGLAYGVGRIGCFLAGDGDYGTPSALPWAVSFPHGVVPTLTRVHPTMLYSSAWELTLFAILWHLSDPRRRPPLKPGALVGCYLIASATGRFLVEFLSRNPRFAFGLTEAQWVSLAMIAGGTLILSRLVSTPGRAEPALCRLTVHLRG